MFISGWLWIPQIGLPVTWKAWIGQSPVEAKISKKGNVFNVLVDDVDLGVCEDLEKAMWCAELTAGEMLVRQLCGFLTTQK